VNENKNLLIVVYFMIPLFLMISFLPLLTEMQWVEAMNQDDGGMLLYPRVIQRDMGLMTPVSDTDPIRQDYDAVMGVLNEIPSAYLDEHTATTSAATITKLKSFLSVTDRCHVAAHGEWDNGPVVLLNGDLDKGEVNRWTTQGHKCKLVFLSACNSMGHIGIQNNDLAYAIIQKSGVSQVIGYDDVVYTGGAATYAALFWAYHLWANGADGGVSSDTAFYEAKEDMHTIMTDALLQALLMSIITSAVISLILGYLAWRFESVLWVLPIIGTIIWGLYSYMFTYMYIASVNAAYYSVVKYGSSVPGLTYPDNGGGGGGCPILSVYDGEDYENEGLLDIHNPEGLDVIAERILSTRPERVDGRYLLQLTEHPQTISHIDQVKLLARLRDGTTVQLSLLSAIHSTEGQVKGELLRSDDIRVDVLGADHNNGTSEYIDFEFVAPMGLDIIDYIFIIEGNNVIIKR
jgi:hypothetical protein